ncbi:MAG: threonine aldolase family protein, partial [Marinirhabdus sp.]
MNAIVTKNEDPKRYGKVFDTLSVCFSKGLGTPLGTVLAGKNEVMQRAVRVRKVLGGAMRQVGFMAAAGVHALQNNVVRLKDDHKKAAEIANLLKTLPYVKKVEPTETNIVIFYLNGTVPEEKFMEGLASKNIRISTMGQGKLRAVTHLGYTGAHHERFLNVLQNWK